MKLKEAAITILVNEDGATIELYDKEASIQFAEIKLTAEQFCQALSRLGHTPCQIEVHNLDNIGKTMEHKSFEFAVPEKKWNAKNHRELIAAYAQKICPEGWACWDSFNSQNSFFFEGEQRMARCTIRRWV
jgi:hypothetical protein